MPLTVSGGGLVIARHNELRDRVADLAGKSFTPSRVRNDPLIFAGCAVKRPKAKPARSKVTPVPADTPPLEATEQKGDPLMYDLWQNGTDIVHDMRVRNTDSKYHSTKTPEKYPQEAERGKKKMYLEDCLQQRRHLSPFVASVDGLMGVEAMADLKRIASRLATKWWQPYYRTCRYVKSSVSITLIRTTHRFIQGSRVPAQNISVQRPLWEDGSGLNLFR